MTAPASVALVAGHAVSPVLLPVLLIPVSTGYVLSLRPSSQRFGWVCGCGATSARSDWWPSDVEAVLAGVVHTAEVTP